jgi:hypothetical protein
MPRIPECSIEDENTPRRGRSKPEEAPKSAAQEMVEAAGAVYFDACRRLARAINRIKGQRNKR